MTNSVGASAFLRGVLERSQLSHADLAFGDRSGLLSWWSWRRAGESGEGDLSEGSDSPPSARYLTASLTKPLVALVSVQLAAEGCFWLNEPVRTFFPAFRRGPLRTITLRHLLTHTSGLPDMLPENELLRARHAETLEFAEAVAQVDPAFQPGTGISYCSMGFAVLDVVVRSACGQSLRELLAERVFGPLSLTHSCLGLPRENAAEFLGQTVMCELPASQPADCDWHWNSVYWRTLGAPWGGLISTAAELGEILSLVLRGGRDRAGGEVLSAGAVWSSVSNQTQHSVGLSEQGRGFRGWGYGWRMNWLDHSGCFSDLLPHDAFGHWGATGTLMWADRSTGTWAVVLTNQPWERSQRAIQRLSNILAAMALSYCGVAGKEK
jgi:CubicO group peptidase (beta-lactamase class C family)